MLIGIPNCQGRVSPVFDVASRLLVVRVKDGQEIDRREVAIAESRPEGLPAKMLELGIDVLICGAISQPLVCWLTNAGVRVIPHICGEADAVLRASLQDRLAEEEFRMPGCSEGRCGCQHRNRHRETNFKS